MSEKIFKGGHAVMLRLDPSRLPMEALGTQVINTVSLWGDGISTAGMREPHLTLQFVGRNLPASDVGKMLDAVLEIVDRPITLRSSGMFRTWQTSKGRYLVLEFERTLSLVVLRDAFRAALRVRGVAIRDNFEFSPHVTLAESSNVDGPFVPVTWGPVVQPFEIECRELEIKYGARRMVVDL